MGVSVDEPWQDRPGLSSPVRSLAVPPQMRHIRGGVGWQLVLWTAKRDDPPFVNRYPAIAPWRRRDGQNPRGAMDNQWLGRRSPSGGAPVSRAFFSVALLAA